MHNFYPVALTMSIFGLVFTIFLTGLMVKADYCKKLNLLLLNMAATSILHCICFIALWVKNIMSVKDYGKQETNYERILFVINCGCYVELMFAVSILAVERFIAVFRPFRYKWMVTHTRIKVALVLSWLIVIGIRVFYLAANVPLTYQVRIDIGTNTLGLAMQPIVLTSIFVRTKLANQKLKRTSLDFTSRLVILQLVSVGVICLLELVMDMVYIHLDMNLPSKDKSLLGYVMNLIWITNVIAIPAIHIGFKASCLAYLKAVFCKKGKRNSIVQEVHEMERSVVSVRNSTIDKGENNM